MSLEGIKSFTVNHLSPSGFKNDCKRLYGKVFGKLVQALEVLTTVLDKASSPSKTELSFNKSIHKRKAAPWKVATRLHNWRLEQYEQRARSSMKDFLEKLVDKGAGIEDFSSDEAKALASELIDILFQLESSVFKALSIAKDRLPNPEAVSQALRDLFDEVGVLEENHDKLKGLLSETGFLYKFVRASEQLNVIEVSDKAEDGAEFKTFAINCLGINGINFLHNTLMLYYDMTDRLLPDDKDSLQDKINQVSDKDNDLIPLGQAIFNRLRLEN